MGFLGKYHKLFTVCSNRYVTVWNIGHDRRSYTFKQAGAVYSAKFSPEGHQLLTIAADKVWLWRIDDGELVWCISDVEVQKAYFTPGSKGVVSRYD